MTLPTQTWRVSAKYTVTVAGGSITLSEIFTAIKAMLDAEDALGNNYWTYCYQSIGANNEMMFKRKGSPSGVLGTFRAMIFGGTTVPHSSNLHFNVANTASHLHVASCEDHNSDTPTNLYTTGVAMAGKYNPSTKVQQTLATIFGNTQNPRVFMVECDRMCSIWIVTSSTINYGIQFTFGEIVERAVDGVGLWGHFGTRDVLGGTEGGYETPANQSAFPAITNDTTGVPGAVYDTSLSKGLGRVQYTPSLAAAADALQNDAGSVAMVLPIIAGSKQAAGATAPFGIGILRQMRYSIRHTGQLALRDVSNNVKGYLINSGYNAYGRGIFYDQSP